MSTQQLASQIRRRSRALYAFNRWEAENLNDKLSTEQVFSSLGTLYDLLPPDSRRRIEDPRRQGVRIMHEALRHLKSLR